MQDEVVAFVSQPAVNTPDSPLFCQPQEQQNKTWIYAQTLSTANFQTQQRHKDEKPHSKTIILFNP